jgi:hypothetical protein
LIELLVLWAAPPALGFVVGWLVRHPAVALLPLAAVVAVTVAGESLIDQPTYCRGAADCPDPTVSAWLYELLWFSLAASTCTTAVAAWWHRDRIRAEQEDAELRAAWPTRQVAP